MSAFITLRIYAGRVFASESVSDKDGSVAASDTIPVSKPEDEIVAQLPEEDTADEMEPANIPVITEEEEPMWRGDIEPKAEFHGLLPRIVCWGDSLTVSLDGKSAYPDIIRSLSGCEVINYGVESDNTSMIAMREGGLRVNVKATVLPADTTLIPVFLRTENNGHVYFLNQGDGGVNPCEINGIEGELQKLNGSYYFKRHTKGERIAVEEGTRLKTFGMRDAREGDILVIFAGTNDLPDTASVHNIINLERQMLESAGCDKYIIVGLTYAGGIPEINEVNAAMEKAFGDHFVDIRKYMLNYGLADAGITPTSKDAEDIRKGEIPSSLRSDYVHGNKMYHKLLGEQIYRRMVVLGYIPAMKEDLSKEEL